MAGMGKRSTPKEDLRPRTGAGLQPRDWRKIKHPKHTFQEVLSWMLHGHRSATSAEVAAALGMSHPDASMRMARLVKFGLVKKHLARLPDIKFAHTYAYDVTNWGIRFGKEQELI